MRLDVRLSSCVLDQYRVSFVAIYICLYKHIYKHINVCNCGEIQNVTDQVIFAQRIVVPMNVVK